MMMRRSSFSRAGFTLVECLAALIFLAVLLPVVHHTMIICKHASTVAERSEIAAQLAENQMNEVILDGSWNTGSTKGDFGTDWKDYRWELTKADWAQDSMSELTMTVFFSESGQERSVRVTTLASDLNLNTTSTGL